MRGVHFTILPASPCAAEFYEIWQTRSAHHLITYVKFLVDRFSSYGVLTPPKLPFPIDLLRRPYNSCTAVRHCDCNMIWSAASESLLNKLQVLQKKAVRIVSKSAVRAYTLCSKNFNYCNLNRSDTFR